MMPCRCVRLIPTGTRNWGLEMEVNEDLSIRAMVDNVFR